MIPQMENSTHDFMTVDRSQNTGAPTILYKITIGLYV
jgi:hypothetical protein